MAGRAASPTTGPPDDPAAGQMPSVPSLRSLGFLEYDAERYDFRSAVGAFLGCDHLPTIHLHEDAKKREQQTNVNRWNQAANWSRVDGRPGERAVVDLFDR